MKSKFRNKTNKQKKNEQKKLIEDETSYSLGQIEIKQLLKAGTLSNKLVSVWKDLGSSILAQKRHFVTLVYMN